MFVCLFVCVFFVRFKITAKDINRFQSHTRNKVGIMERKRSSGFRSIFTVSFHLFIGPAGDSNPSGQSLTFT